MSKSLRYPISGHAYNPFKCDIFTIEHKLKFASSRVESQ